MNKTQQLCDLGQSLWLDNITRKMLDDGSLRRTIEEFSITGLTSNPTIFDAAIGNSGAYDEGIREKAGAGKSGDALFMELALEDLRRAADLFRSIFDATDRVDGWVSMEVAAAGPGHGRQHRGCRANPCAGGSAEPVCQDSGHAGRNSRDRGIDLRRRADQRHPAVLARAVSRRRRGLSARHRAPAQSRARSADRVGRLAVRQPLGQSSKR